jgi:hypothetical protein
MDLSAECALFFGVSDRTIIRREAKKGHKNPFVPLPSPATPPPSLREMRGAVGGRDYGKTHSEETNAPP